MTARQHMACRCCSQPADLLFDDVLLGRRVHYYECAQCGYVQTQDPDWLEEAYTHALNATDTGLVRRSSRNTRLVAALMSVLGCLHEPVLDFAGGSGLLVRMLRDRGIDARWHDPHAENVFARGFEHAGERVALLTAFEVLEHMVHPAQEFARMASWADVMLYSTEIIPTPTPRPEAWGYYGREHGQHIGFYRMRTLQWLAESIGWHLHSDGQTYHLFTRRPLAAWRWRMARHATRLLHGGSRLRLKSLTGADQQRLLRQS